MRDARRFLKLAEENFDVSLLSRNEAAEKATEEDGESLA